MGQLFSIEHVQKIKEVLEICRVRSYRDCVKAFADMLEKDNKYFDRQTFVNDLLKH